MRTLTRITPVTLLIAFGSVASAADPLPPLVKPVAPGGGAVRVRVPLDAKNAAYPVQLAAQIPKPGKKGEMLDAVIALDLYPNSTEVSLQQWKAWGFEVPMNRIGVVPELVLAGAQIAPKPAKGRDVEFRAKDVKVTIREYPGGDKAGLNNTLILSLRDLTGGADRAFEPRVYFPDKFIELTAPGAAVKKLNSGDMTSADPQSTNDDKLVPAVVTMVGTTPPVATFASVNGQTQYFTSKGKLEPVFAGMSSYGGPAPGITMSVAMARGCNVELDKEANPTKGKVKELRIGMLTGTGFKTEKDLVLKDVTVWIHPEESLSFIWLGPDFVMTHMKDGVYGCASDGVWRLHGRVKPDLLEDAKTRKPVQPKKP